jgi:predicted RNA binding protein YcfA (HicA-like mRNA interferase family)
MVHTESGKIIPIPTHKGKDVSVGLIRAILRELDVSPDQWNEL